MPTVLRVEAEDAKRLEHFDLAFRDLYVRDLVQADRGDVRMGTFILCAAFLDALALAYSAGVKVKGGKGGKWDRFVRAYLGEAYEPICASYGNFRNLLLHNYSIRGFAFIHGAERAALHLQRVDGRGDVILHRETFVGDVVQAFERFAEDVHADADLRKRVFAHFDRYSPMGLIQVEWNGPEVTAEHSAGQGQDRR